MTIVIQENIPEELIFQIAPEQWTMTSWTMLTLFSMGGIIVAIGFFYSLCIHSNDDMDQEIQLFKNHVLPSLLHFINTASDFWYLLVVPTFDSKVLIAQIATLFLPQLVFFRYAMIHAWDGKKDYGEFLSHFFKRYFAMTTGQIDYFLKK